jgi:hypothetical protein
VSMHVVRRPDEPVDSGVQAFYSRLLACLRHPEVHEGQWSLWVCRSAWAGNDTWQNMIVTTWVQEERRLVVVVNYSAHPSQCYVTFDLPNIAGRRFNMVDLLGDARYERDGDGLTQNGLYLDVPPWGHHAFELRAA